MKSIHVFGRETVAALTAAQSAQWDRSAREQGVAERALMEEAGHAVAAVLQILYPRGRVLALVGSGHNGGDALVALRILKTWGREVEYHVASAREPDLGVLHGHDLPSAPAAQLERALSSADVIIDGLLGTGAHGAPRDPLAPVIRAANRAERPMVAVDLPSGVDADDGSVEGAAIRAQVTVSFGAAKVGLLLQPARSYCGRLLIAEIGFPSFGEAPAGQLITPEWAHRRLPRRAPDAHKGTAGRLIVLAGSYGMAGAAAIAGRAALRAGAGLVRIVSVKENRIALQTLVPEATFFDRAADPPASGIQAVVAGCGMGTDEPALEALARVLDVTDTLPAILDADALNLLAGRADRIAAMAARRPLVLTPHVRELARISGIAEHAILRDRPGSARAFSESTQAVVLLKGAPSVVAAPQQPLLISTTGSSDVATGGMGDQLAGMIGAFLASGASPREAAALALFYGGRGADLAHRGRSLSPQDVSNELYRAFRSPGARTSTLGLPFLLFDQPARW